MRVAITGSTGFIGYHLRRELESADIEVVPITRRDFQSSRILQKVGYCDGIIHLAGESIGGIWTKSKKRKIYDSRVLTARMLVDACITLKGRIKFYVAISGVGIYDHIHRHTESSTHYADNFLARVIRDWEGEAKRLIKYEVKTVIIRTGIVLGKNEGILSLFTLPFRYRIGFSVENQDSFPVIHIDDLVRVFHAAVTDKGMEGVFNAVTPGRITVKEFFSLIRAYYKPWIMLRVTIPFLRVILGESALLLTEGQNVLPDRLSERKFVFTHASPDVALMKALDS